MKTKSGKELFPVGIGTWLISGSYTLDESQKYRGAAPVYGNEETEIEALRYSVSKGQNHFDCAELYGAFYTDEVVGRAIAGLNREDIYIADKLWKTSVGAGQVRPTVQKMLEKLGTDYLDMLYIHSPWKEVDWKQAIPQIDELIDEGAVREFGVSNFTIDDMKVAQEIAKHPITANQVHYNVLNKSEVSEEFRQFCAQNNIQIVAYQPVKRREVLANEAVQRIAKSHNASPAQVALAWLIAKGTLPIPKATQKAHIDENVAAAELQLSAEDVAELDNL